MISANIAESKTAPAATSLVFSASECWPGEVRSVRNSSAVLIASAVQTNPMHKSNATHSPEETSKKRAKLYSASNGRNPTWFSTLGPYLRHRAGSAQVLENGSLESQNITWFPQLLIDYRISLKTSDARPPTIGLNENSQTQCHKTT